MFVPNWLMMYHCKIKSQTEMTLQFESFQYERVKMSKWNNLHVLWRVETSSCIKLICVGLIFKYGVSCSFHGAPTVYVFVSSLIDDVIAIKKTATAAPHTTNWLVISPLRTCYVNITWMDGFLTSLISPKYVGDVFVLQTLNHVAPIFAVI